MRRLYRAQFQIEPAAEHEQPRLRSVPAACLRWVFNRRDFAHGQDLTEILADPMSPLERVESDSGYRAETLALTDNEPLEWALRFSHLDSEDQTIRWTTEVALRKEEDHALEVVCTVFVGREGGTVAPVFREPSRPRVVDELIRAFPCRVDRKLASSPRTITPEQAGSLLEFLTTEKRKLPVVLVTSDNRTDRPLIDVDALCSWLSGVAHVYVTTSRFTSVQLEDLHDLPHWLNAWDGAIRIYWPGFNFGANPRHHNLWTPTRIRRYPDGMSLRSAVMRPIALAAVAQHNRFAPSWLELEGRLRRRRFQDLREKGIKQKELEALYEQMLASLERDNEELDAELTETKAKVFELEQQNQAYVLALQEGVQGAAKLHEEREAPANLEEAVKRAEQDFGDRMVFCLNSASNVKDNQFERADEAFLALEFLATEWWEAKIGGGHGGDFDHRLREKCGWQYRGNQSKVTMKRWENEYSTRWNGNKYWLEAHLATRSSKDQRHSLRIAFAWDEPSKKIVVGYIGQHQRTSAS